MIETSLRCLVLFSTYRDSVWLMHLSHTLENLPGVQRVAVMMGTPHNKALLQQAGLLTAAGEAGGANDLLICVQAETPTVAAEALRQATARMAPQKVQGVAARAAAPRTSKQPCGVCQRPIWLASPCQGHTLRTKPARRLSTVCTCSCSALMSTWQQKSR